MSNHFPAVERLKSRKLISKLFADRQSIGEYPFRFFWKKVDELEVPLQVAFTVPKRKHKLAVNRNRIRRRMKEAYRLNKQTLIGKLEVEGINVIGLLLFVAKEDKFSFEELNTRLSKLLKQLEKVLIS